MYEPSKPASINSDHELNSDATSPKRPAWFYVEETTALHINIRRPKEGDDSDGTSSTAMLDPKQALDLFLCFGQCADFHGISIIEHRTDSFVCILDANDPNSAGDSVGQLLTFAADLNHRLVRFSVPLEARMGMASGPTTLVGSTPAVIGNAANIAEDMARLAAAAAVAVHESALWRWAAAARRTPPAAAPVNCMGGQSARAAMFDLEAEAFRPSAAAAAAAAASAAAAPRIVASAPPPCAARRLSRSASV